MIMNDIRKAIEGLLGKIFLTKKVMFGLDENKIVIIVSPSLKIFELVARPAKALNNFPFEKTDIWNLIDLSHGLKRTVMR